MIHFEFSRIYFLFFTGIIFLQATILFSQDVEFTASVSKNPVPAGETFKLTFTLNASGKNFRAPDLSAFSVISGPNQSSSMQIINGDISQSLSFTYYLVAGKEGKYTIGAASIIAGGKSVSSDPVEIEVTKGAPPVQQKHQQQQQANPQGKQQQSPAEAQSAAADKLFLTAQVNKQKVCQGEQLIVTYKLYFRVNIVDNSVKKLPNLNGFWTEDVKMPAQAQISSEVVNGMKYNVAELKKTILFPQRSGTLEIDPMEFECVVRYQKQPTSFWDFPFGGYQDAKYVLKSKSIPVTVLPLPKNGQPVGFSGAVGNYSMSVTIDKTNVKTNEAITIKASFNGKGNLKLIEKPKISIPADIESYDPKVTDKSSVSPGGVSGSKTYEYLLIPRHAGDFRITPFSFSFFDPEKNSYMVLSSPEFEIHVEKGTEQPQVTYSSMMKEDIKLIGSDIRYIKSTVREFNQKGKFFFLSLPYYGMMAAPFALFLLFVVIRRREQELSRDVVRVRQRRAGIMARRKLAKVKKYLSVNKNDEFYDEMLRALWGFASEKLNIAVSELSKENIITGLERRKVSVEATGKLITLLDACELSRYAPLTASKTTLEIFNEAGEVISAIEDEIS